MAASHAKPRLTNSNSRAIARICEQLSKRGLSCSFNAVANMLIGEGLKHVKHITILKKDK